MTDMTKTAIPIIALLLIAIIVLVVWQLPGTRGTGDDPGPNGATGATGGTGTGGTPDPKTVCIVTSASYLDCIKDCAIGDPQGSDIVDDKVPFRVLYCQPTCKRQWIDACYDEHECGTCADPTCAECPPA